MLDMALWRRGPVIDSSTRPPTRGRWETDTGPPDDTTGAVMHVSTRCPVRITA